MILAVLAIVLTLVLVIGIHEMGHAFAAKLLSVKIQRISIGLGKPILTWKDKADCEWVWAMWPLGGYVLLLNSRIQTVKAKEYPYCFDKKPIWMRCCILLAGALANLLLAFLALMLMFILGYSQQEALIKSVEPQSMAASAGLKDGERFLSLAGKEVRSWQEVGMRLIMSIGKPEVQATLVDAQGKVHETTLDLSQWQKPKHSLLTSLGITPDSHKSQVAGQSLSTAVRLAAHKIIELLSFFIIMIKQLVIGAIPFGLLLGPFGLLGITVSSLAQGFSVFMYFIASLSLAVGLINLLPVPSLDGGSLVYALLEKIRGKPVSIAWEILMHRFAVIIFSLLLVQLVLNDLERYIS